MRMKRKGEPPNSNSNPKHPSIIEQGGGTFFVDGALPNLQIGFVCFCREAERHTWHFPLLLLGVWGG
jgi:hypothetical protein